MLHAMQSEPSASPERRRARSHLSLPQVLLVIVVLAGLGLAGWWGVGFLGERRQAARVQAAVPRLLAGIRAERVLIEAAIDAYRTEFHFYPPDHVVSRQPLVIDAVTNQLLYEIGGTAFDPTNRIFTSPRGPPLAARHLPKYLQIQRFSNVVNAPAEPHGFLPASGIFVAPLTDKYPGLRTFGFAPLPEEVDPETSFAFTISPWRYVSTQPTHNPGKFDLWIEVRVNDQKLVVGNWKDAE